MVTPGRCEVVYGALVHREAIRYFDEKVGADIIWLKVEQSYELP